MKKKFSKFQKSVLIYIFVPLALLFLMMFLSFFYFRLTHENNILRLVKDRYSNVELEFDVNGVPTIGAADALQTIKTQGYVHAAERLWQMELMSRFALGELSEWFGEKALKHDRSKRMEFWKEYAIEHQDLLPIDERSLCDAYSEGVNQFIADRKYWFGIEYTFLGKKPRAWQCFHSLSIMMAMIDSLASSAQKEFVHESFHKKLPPTWQKFLFPWKHPWNIPTFENPNVKDVKLDYSELKLPKIFSNDKIDSILLRIHESLKEDFAEPIYGSNAWVLRKNNKAVLANDPHLAYRVPQLWYASILKFGQTNWVKGFSIPGIPGVVLGKNQDIAWAFTNTAEDVDDDLILKDSDFTGEKLYMNVDSILGTSGEVLEKVERSKFRGLPVIQRNIQGNDEDKQMVARQYIVFVPGKVRLPILKLNLATDWQSFNAAVDAMYAPSQNILFLDKNNNFGYRTSGVTIQRQITGLFLAAYDTGKWLGFASSNERRRIFCKHITEEESKEHSQCRHGYIVNANERVWIDSWNHHWASDDRKRRIVEVIQEKHLRVVPEESYFLQLDTSSIFHKELMSWIYKKLDSLELEKRMPLPAITKHHHWDGNAQTCVDCFTEAVVVERAIRALILILIGDSHGIDFLKEPKFKHRLDRSWTLDLVEGRLQIWQLGITETEFLYLISEVVQKFRKSKFKDYRDWNRWGTQHPFARQIPWLGKMFEVDSFTQKGFIHLVRSERQQEGASLRAVWTFAEGEKDIFSVPVGQSGHFYSKNYSNLRKQWLSETPIFW